jgi:hypothetical protein
MDDLLRRWRVVPLLWLLLCGSLPAAAERIPHLYLASVPVAGQSPAELNRAARAGLAEVVVRVSGQSASARHPALAAAIGNAERYLYQYRYENNPSTAPDAAPLLAHLSFSQPPIESLLREAGLPLWGDNRPVLLVWLAVDEDGNRALVNQESHQDLMLALQQQARRRGLALRFPLLDLADMSALSAEDVWQMDLLKIRAPSERYRADALLVGRINAVAGGRWLGGWTLAVNGQRVAVDGEGDGLSAFLTPTIDRLADALAAQYAVAADGAAAQAVRLRLVGVASFSDYARVLTYLGRVGSVKQVDTLQISGDEMLLQLQIEGQRDQLVRALALDHRLVPQAEIEAEPAAIDAGAEQLEYRWVSPRG